MSLSTPSLYTIAAFDAAFAHIFYFSVSGGSQVVANRLMISRNSDNVVIYNDVVTSYSFTHTISANILSNGAYYVAKIKTYASGDDTTSLTAGSEWSQTVPFYCYTTPTLTWTNQPTGSVIQTSTFTFQFSYTQAEDERLYSYIINLYDISQNLISTSGTQYVSSLSPTISYKVEGLLHQNSYYIEVNGETVNATQITTGKILFSVTYDEPFARQGFSATNDACNGQIILANDIVYVDSTSNPSPPTYVYSNTAVDLTNSGDYVKFYGMNDSGDFCVRIWGYDFTSNEKIFQYSQSEMAYNISVYRRDGYDYGSSTLQTYYELQVQVGNTSNPYFIYSNYINQPESTDKVFICIKRIDNIYSLYIQNLE